MPQQAGHAVSAPETAPRRRVDRVVMLVLDGMRADMLSPTGTPHLWQLAAGAQRFRRARSVFPSYTRVCTASVLAGGPPALHGIVGNAFHHPAAGEDAILYLDCLPDLRRLVAAEGRAVLAPTLPEILASAGLRFAAVNGNSAGTGALMLPEPVPQGTWLYTPHGRANSTMPEAWDTVTARFGAPPPAEVPLLARTAWLGRVFAEEVLERQDPDVALLWLAEPDTSLHYRGPGHAATAEALAVADAAAGLALATLERLGRRARTAVIAFSDHGQIACPDQLALPQAWAGLGIAERFGEGVRASAVRGRCGGMLLAPGPAREERAAELAAALGQRPEIGLLFGRAGVPGTLPLGLVCLDHPRAPDLVYVLEEGWTTAGDVPPGGGMHGGLHPIELANLLLFALPGLAGTDREAPAGLVDIAPTVLALMGLAAPEAMTGRDLTAADPPWTLRRERGALGAGAQQVEIARAGRADYVIAGGRLASGQETPP